VQVRCPPAPEIFVGKIARFKKKVPQGVEELSVEMCNIIYEMREQVPEAFMGFNIFLPAYMAIPSMNRCLAVETYFFLSFAQMGHLLTFD
jgi:hypothetical protein